jgi:CDP-diacylglycerol--serine O-phosphatidyltransferase
MILAYFVVCRISRLARFNVRAKALSDKSGKVKYFEGTPIPTSIVVLLGVALYVNAIDGALWLGVYRIGPATLHPSMSTLLAAPR